MFERRISGEIFGLKRTNEGEYELRNNNNLYDLYNEPSIVRTLKSMR